MSVYQIAVSASISFPHSQIEVGERVEPPTRISCYQTRLLSGWESCLPSCGGWGLEIFLPLPYPQREAKRDAHSWLGQCCPFMLVFLYCTYYVGANRKCNVPQTLNFPTYETCIVWLMILHLTTARVNVPEQQVALISPSDICICPVEPISLNIQWKKKKST